MAEGITGSENHFTYYDLWQEVSSQKIDLIFPGWQEDQERVLVISPHDDDGVLGAGYSILAAMENGAEIFILVVCNGCFGYSRVEDKGTIVARRKAETTRAYHQMGIPEEHILRIDFPDFSAWSYLGWHHPGGAMGSTARLLPLMRQIAPTRVILPNGYREHQDHEAAFRMGAYDAPQVGDAILAELGLVDPVRSYLQYSVWADFDPMEALCEGTGTELRANLSVQVNVEVEERIAAAIGEFESQQQVIRDLLERRKIERFRAGSGIELYLTVDPRPVLDFTPYHQKINEINRKGENDEFA